MKTRKIGRSGLTVSGLGLGCMGMSMAYGTRNDEESIRTLHRAMELGVTLIDTAVPSLILSGLDPMLNKIAKQIGVHKSTIGREIQRNSR